MPFAPATRKQSKLKMAIIGPPKSGKTFTGLKILSALVGPNGRIAAIDTEHGSMSKYAGNGGFKFDVENLMKHHPREFIDRIYEAHKAGYDALLIDSLSHEWVGRGGCLEWKDELLEQKKNPNDFAVWAQVTPIHNELFRVINAAPLHIICTFRVKTAYTMETQERNGRQTTVPVKVGLEPVTRDGAEYEFDIVMDMNKGKGYIDHMSRCAALQNIAVQHPGEELAGVIKAWLEDGNIPDLAPPPVKEETMVRTTEQKPAPQKGDARPAVPDSPKPAPNPQPASGAASRSANASPNAAASAGTTNAPAKNAQKQSHQPADSAASETQTQPPDSAKNAETTSSKEEGAAASATDESSSAPEDADAPKPASTEEAKESPTQGTSEASSSASTATVDGQTQAPGKDQMAQLVALAIGEGKAPEEQRTKEDARTAVNAFFASIGAKKSLGLSWTQFNLAVQHFQRPFKEQ